MFNVIVCNQRCKQMVRLLPHACYSQTACTVVRDRPLLSAALRGCYGCCSTWARSFGGPQLVGVENFHVLL